MTHYDVPIAEAKMVLMEVTGAALKTHAQKQTLRAKIEEAQTKDEVEAIEWEF